MVPKGPAGEKLRRPPAGGLWAAVRGLFRPRSEQRRSRTFSPPADPWGDTLPGEDPFATGPALGRTTPASAPLKPELPRAAERAAAARQRFAEDRCGSLEELQALARDYAPDPFVLHALCLCLVDSGKEGQAVAVAREAIPLCFQRRQGMLAAQIFDAIAADAQALGLDRGQQLALGASLIRTPFWELGFRSLAGLLIESPHDRDSFEKLAELGRYLLEKADEPRGALNVFQFLLVMADTEPRRAEIEAWAQRAENALPAVAPDQQPAPRGPAIDLSDIFADTPPPPRR